LGVRLGSYAGAVAMKSIRGPFSLERVVQSFDNVRHRLLRTVAVLRAADIPYAIVGGNAVALWVSRADPEAVRTTRNVDILLRRDDLVRARAALEANGFTHCVVAGVDMFLDGPDASPRSAVQVIFANEKVHGQETLANPDVTDSEETDVCRVLTLDALVRIKLTTFRDHDRTHLRDLIHVGLLIAVGQVGSRSS